MSQPNRVGEEKNRGSFFWWSIFLSCVRERESDHIFEWVRDGEGDGVRMGGMRSGNVRMGGMRSGNVRSDGFGGAAPNSELEKTKEHKLVHPPKFRNLETEMQKGYKILLAFSGLKHALTSNPGYNCRVAECREAARLLLHASGNEELEPLLSNVEPTTYETNKSKLEPSLARRAEHYFSENARVTKGHDAWASGELEEFGKLISASGLSSIQNYECGCEPLIQLYEILVRTPGVYGARFSGAGFRGCCIAFVAPDSTNEAASFVRNEYQKLQPKLANKINRDKAVLICDAGDGACVI